MHWYVKACQKMIRESKSLFLVSNELDLGITARQAEELLRDTEFQNTLRGEKLRYYKELAADPARSKQSNIGNLLYLADQLIVKGLYDKAANVIMSVMKAEGQLEDKTTVNVFADLTDRDLQAMRETVEKRKKAELAN